MLVHSAFRCYPQEVKYFSIVFGLLVGWFLSKPPAFLTAMGAPGYLAAGGLAGIAFVVFISAQIRASLPETLWVEPCQDGLPDGVQEVLTQFRALGFEPGQPVIAHMSPPALVVPAYHPDSRCFAVVFRTGTVPAKIACDFLSDTEDDSHSLTTGSEVGGGALPGAETRFKQFFPGVSIETLYRRHLEALEFLTEKGLKWKAIRPGQFESDLQKGIRRQRQHFLQSPLLNTLITIGRAVSNRNPHLGPVQNQPLVVKALDKFQ